MRRGAPKISAIDRRFGHAIALAAILCSCSGKPANPAAPSDLEAAIAAARYAVAADPGDMAAHVRLARLYERAERPGGALRHFEIAERDDELPRADRARLAALYRARAQARIDLGDSGALIDVRAAKRLDPKTSLGAVEIEAYFLAAAGALRRGDRDDRVRAKRLLAAARKLAPRDERLAVLGPETATTRALGAAAAWAYRHRAKRVALELYELYVQRDGRQREHLIAWMDVYRWWHGTRKRPSLLLLRELQEAGINMCPFAREPDELGCSDSLLRIVGDVDAERLARTHAAALSWRTAQTEAAAAWTAITLRAWLAGDARSWLGELSQRVDVDAVAGPGADPDVIPRFAAPTLLRAAGRDAAARLALDRAIESSRTMSAARRAVLTAEAAAQGRSSAVIDVLLGPQADPAAWTVALRAAHAGADTAREASLLDDAPARLALEHARATAAFGVLLARWPDRATAVERRALHRWWVVLDDDSVSGGRDAVARPWQALAGDGGGWALPRPANAVAFGVPDPVSLASELGLTDTKVVRELVRIARAYLDDPAIADRLANDFADGAVAVGQRGPIVAELFARMADPARARDWRTRVLRSSKRHWEYLMAAGTSEAATQNHARADVLFIEGAARSGDAGAANLAAARAYARHGAALESIGAGRRALQLTAPGLEADVMEILVQAMLLLSRDSDASDVLVAFTERAPAPFQDAARARALSMWGDRAPTKALAGPVWRSRRAREIRGDIPAATDPMDPRVADDTFVALRWNPGDAAARAKALDTARGDQKARLIAELLAIGLTARREKAVLALEAVADALDAMGKQQLAEKARREATALR